MASVVVYQTINFHHYVVDGLIWKVRKPRLQQTLALATSRQELSPGPAA